MKTAILFLFLALPASSQVIRQNGGVASTISPNVVNASTVTITGTGSKCFSVDDPTLVVDCGNDRVGIGTASPATTLDVNGNAQFGSGGTKSTFTATGALTLAGGVRVGGTLYSVSSSSNTGATNSTDWIIADQYTIPANTLSANGDSIGLFCIAKATTTSLTKGLEFSINGVRTNNGTTSVTDTRWVASLTLIRASASTGHWETSRQKGSTFVSDISATAGASIDFTAAITVSCDLRSSSTAYGAAAGDENMISKMFRVRFNPAP